MSASRCRPITKFASIFGARSSIRESAEASPWEAASLLLVASTLISRLALRGSLSTSLAVSVIGWRVRIMLSITPGIHCRWGWELRIINLLLVSIESEVLMASYVDKNTDLQGFSCSMLGVSAPKSHNIATRGVGG